MVAGKTTFSLNIPDRIARIFSMGYSIGEREISHADVHT